LPPRLFRSCSLGSSNDCWYGRNTAARRGFTRRHVPNWSKLAILLVAPRCGRLRSA
jgi:hypothetical protein